MNKEINNKFFEKALKEYNKCCKNKVLRHALTNSSIFDLVRSLDTPIDTNFAFSKDIQTSECANQKETGRCWIFAGTNVLREIIMNKLNMKDFELSQSYIAFYDKLEKINYKLESFIKLIDVHPTDRVYAHLLQTGIEDGGQWDMFVNIVKKYGIVPKNVFPETYQSSNTRELNKLIDVELRKFSANSKEIYATSGIEKLREVKDELMEKFYFLLLNAYGNMVTTFKFEYVDKDGNYHCKDGYTPKSFFEEFIGSKIDEYVSIINSPTSDKPFYETYTIDFLGNVVEGKEIVHLNLPIERLKELVVTQLLNDELVWFGCDCGKYYDKDNCIWDINSFDYQTPFNLDYKIDKTKALDYGISKMDHAMVFTGVSINEGKTTRFKVENSWGANKINKGYYVMTDKWFDMYVYQAAINRKYLNELELKAYEKRINVLKPWDPMGSLADE